MNPSNTSERAFEEAIESALLSSGYLNSYPQDFDAKIGIDTTQLFNFIEDTQPDTWNELKARAYASNTQRAREGFTKRLVQELDKRGTVDVLRHGVTDYGVDIKLAYFKPAHALTQQLINLYNANRVTVTRQLPYEPTSNKTIDLCLLVNGIPTATAELKNPSTGQNMKHAINQYRTDRDPSNLTLSKRAIVHFAVDPYDVYMTTKLSGVQTRFFPFNQGSGGAGRDGGAGNPANKTGYRTAYLWENVWQRDIWMDILYRFVHRPGKDSSAIVFPRLHQWHAVQELEKTAKSDGAGYSYLVQHSAGSGKSITIGWLAHRLSNLHSDNDAKVFDKVVVITDRRVLDRQLQETIYQLEHAHGVVAKIDRDSAQLARELVSEGAKIIITTLQKFSYVMDRIADAPHRKYAVIIDEAHSSQTGDSARNLRAALSASKALQEAEHADAADETQRGDGQDQVAKIVAGRGRNQPNISFFAFTATPKATTLELFGKKTENRIDERFIPFHIYSMRQAIQEEFILDVLKNYTTYHTYWRIQKSTSEDPTYDQRRAKTAIARFVSLEPHQLDQKSEIIVEHYRQNVAHRINGRAKAMVVTSSRLHAVRYKQAIDRYIRNKGYKDASALVAFSGKVIDDADEFSESAMNGFRESETAEKFNTDEYHILIVAEKFQTGFDQPLLHTMYVDKTLTGLNAVQTLSRLNRIHPDKTETFVLDFRNEVEQIQNAFAPWYERTEAIPTDPNILWDAHRQLMGLPVIHKQEIKPTVDALRTHKKTNNHQQIHKLLDPAIARFNQLDPETQTEFRDALKRFISLYRFIAQIISFTDHDMENDYTYARALDALLPKDQTIGIDISQEVELTHLRIEQTYKGSASIVEGDSEVRAMIADRGKDYAADEEALSKIINTLNERFGTEFTEADQLLFDQIEHELVSNQEIQNQARSNNFDNFELEFNKQFIPTALKRMDDNDAILEMLLANDPTFRQAVTQFYADRIYRVARGEEQPRMSSAT